MFKLIFALLLCLPFMSQALTMDEYEDSVAAAQKTEREAKFMPASIPSPSIEVTRTMTLQDSAVIDSFATECQRSETTWNSVRRLRDVILTSDRINALSFYLKRGVMSKVEVEKMAIVLQSGKQNERAGTLYIIAHQSGNEQVKAHAHLIKLRGEISTIENFLFALHDNRILVK